MRILSKKNFSIRLFVIFFLTLLLMSGIHQGLLVLQEEYQWGNWVQTLVPSAYWMLVAIGLTLYTRIQIRNNYEVPEQRLAEATAKVANGDFSVYVPTIHSADQLDYLDRIILDFNKMVEELGSIETLKTDFFSNVSHEIKTPLAIIQNNAELLQKAQLTEEQRQECTDTILQATKRLSSLITNMLKLNKLEKQVIKPKPELFDICAQICECALQFEDIWEKKRIEFEADMEDRAMICADEGLLEIVWTNLISNAMKFTPEGGTVTISQTSDQEKITVCISDNGCGMSDETRKRIFDKFYQGDISHATEGNGLGLALVQRILELSDGAISVKSKIGEGTVFTITLPAVIKENDIEK